MKLIPILLLLAMLSACEEVGTDAVDSRPNVLLIVADDLGYSDLGSFGGEINTPNLDALAGSGVKLTNFYAAPTCSPSRSMLLSGMDNHLVGMGAQRYYWSEEQKGRPGYEGQLNDRFVTVAMRLKDAGYHTYMAGKWHLGYDSANYPSGRGFEESFALLEGGASHFDQRGVIPNAPKANYVKNGEPVDLPKDFFSSEFYTDTLIDNIESNREGGKPFFVYASYTAPHWPLQAPEEFIDIYKGAYSGGYDEIVTARLEHMQAKGIIPEEITINSGPDFFPEWDELSANQKKIEARLMEVYAGMVDALDFHIGRLIQYLENSGQLENTVVIFLSDNGAEGANPLEINTTGTPNSQWIPENFDNSFDNIGKQGSYVSVGPGWARVSSLPSRLYKGFTSEGGLKVPAFIYSKKMARQALTSNQFVSVTDIAPTLMELAGIDPLIDTHNDRDVLPMTGTSLLGYLKGEEESVHGDNHSAAWELFGRRAARMGDWKMIWLNEPWGSGRWQLYNLAEDPGETEDLFAKYPDVVSKLEDVWNDYVEQNEMVVVDKVDIRYINSTSHYQANEIVESERNQTNK